MIAWIIFAVCVCAFVVMAVAIYLKENDVPNDMEDL
jgi:hypothetical protein